MSVDYTEAELDALFQAMLDQTITEEQCCRLEEILASDKDVRSTYIRLVEVDALLENAFHEDDSVVIPVARRTRYTIEQKSLLIYLASVVCGVVLVLAGVFLQKDEQVIVPPDVIATQHDLPVVAHVELIGFEALRGDVAYKVGDELSLGEIIQLDRGVMKLRFAGGAVVTINGYAYLELLSSNSCALNAGQLVARIPKSAKGFTVQTPSGKIVDLGTEFGVEISQGGASESHVFDGSVDVIAGRAGAKERKSTIVGEGRAVAFNMQSSQILPVEFQPRRFSKPLSLINGINKSSGSIFLTVPPKRLKSGDLADSKKLFIIPEQQDLEVSPKELELIKSVATPELSSIPERVSSVDCFILHADLGSQGEVSGVIGFVEFERPILAVIANGYGLTQTDAFLGNSETVYIDEDMESKKRDVEFGPGTTEADKLAVSADRKRLTFDLRIVKAIDQFRVLVKRE